MHPNRQFAGLCVVHIPSCLHVLLRLMRHLCWGGGGGGEGTVALGKFPRGCDNTVARRRLSFKGGGGVAGRASTPSQLLGTVH